MPSATTNPSSHAVLDFIHDDRMHRELTLPATAKHDALNVSYADVGQLPAPSGAGSIADHPTVLFIPGMFASRFLSLTLHTIAEKLGVRVLVVDRPGMGRSTNVPLEQRIPVWIELVPYLLQHLGIRHVSLASHSAGTMFLLNTLQDCRDVLHPDRPFVALLGPFVDPSHSKVVAMHAARLVPTGAFGVWNLLPKFAMTQARPVFSYSGTLFTGLSNAVFGSGSQEGEQTHNCRRLDLDYGIPGPIQLQMQELALKAMFAEDTVGANGEALLCLKKGSRATWGACQDYNVFAERLYKTEQERLRAGAGTDDLTRAKLKIRVYFAESDAMSGKKGQAYLMDCFQGEPSPGRHAASCVDFEASTVSGTDHDSVIGMVDVLEEVFVQAGGHLPGPR